MPFPFATREDKAMEEPRGEIIIYESADAGARVEVWLEDETVWLDAHQMAELFQRDRSVILKHVHNIYNTGELDQGSTCAKFAQVAKDGKTRLMDLYNLDVIIGVGYRVTSRGAALSFVSGRQASSVTTSSMVTP